MNKTTTDCDCTKKCKSRSHGKELTNAITKRLVTDEAIAGFIKGTCTNFTQAFDSEGRTALHMTVSRGRHRLMEWLVRNSSEAFINARDRESGYTSLHRSIFYGQIHIAVALMKIGVNTDIVDKDDYKALDHAILDRQYMYKHLDIQPCDVYVWGSNSNYTLGTGTQQQKKIPDLLNCFNRINASVKQVCFGKFHSVWVCGDSIGSKGCEAWICGQLSRIGTAAGTALRPVSVRLPEPCLQAAVTLNSTIFLLQSGIVIEYSLKNTDNVVSQSNVKSLSTVKLPSVKPLMKLANPIGICASRVHAVVWNVRAIYTWGTNFGQLGHSQPTDKYVESPKRVAITMNNKEEAGIQFASASDAATVITNRRGDVYLLNKHICKKIAIKQINLKQVCVEAKVNENGTCPRVTVLLLTTVGQLLIWQDTNNMLNRCVFGFNHQKFVTYVTMSHDAIIFTTKYGEAFIGNISRKNVNTQPIPIKKDKERDTSKSSLVKFLEKDDCVPVRITRIPNIHRAVSLAVDSEGLNFACLQIKPTYGMTSFPELSPSSFSKHMQTLLETATEDDILHDVVFQVGNRTYPVHMFVIATASEYLHKLYIERNAQKDIPIINLENVHPDVFERILQYMYTGSCDVVELGPCNLKIRKEDLMADLKKDKENMENEFELISNSSAFEVYKKQNKKKSQKNRNKITEVQRTHTICDPIKLVQASAKRLQVMALHKLLDKFYYKEGSICLKDSADFTKNKPHFWNRESLTEIADTNVCSKDGELISAHKCVLASRLEYFQGMFMHAWTESETKSTVTLPVNHAILLPVINFLYTDTCPEVESSESIDFISSMLIVADQLFINRLREMCEVALVNLITLKNCSDLCQFAHTYNATQLKQYCMEFISLNACTLLESRSLEILQDNLLEDITKYYCQFNPIMSCRVITPFFNAPSDEIVNERAKLYPVDLNSYDEDIKKENIIIEISKKKAKHSKKTEYTENEKARMQYESVSSVNSLDLSNDSTGDITLSLNKIINEKKSQEKREKWIEVPTAQQKQQKVLQARLKAINFAGDISNETQRESFTKLTKSSPMPISSPKTQDCVTPTTSRMSVSPIESVYDWGQRSPVGSVLISHVSTKLSQKQRKKLTLQGDSQTVDENQHNNLPNTINPPKNPWKTCDIARGCSKKSDILEFNKILADQKKQKDDFSRIMTKPLALTQLEDKAIEELERFYNVHEIDDEYITVNRIELKVSSPQWIHTVHK